MNSGFHLRTCDEPLCIIHHQWHTITAAISTMGEEKLKSGHNTNHKDVFEDSWEYAL